MKSDNFCSNLRALINRWDDPAQVAMSLAKLKISPFGNINRSGTFKDGAYILTKNDRNFYRFIEPGIRRLVRVVIQKFDFISFSSCEGHETDDRKVYLTAHVALIPRNATERKKMRHILHTTCKEVNKVLKANGQHALELTLSCPWTYSDDGRPLKSVFLVFRSKVELGREYFQQLPAAQKATTDFLKRHF